MTAEIDMAQDAAELDEQAISDQVKMFLRQDFTTYDTALSGYYESAPQIPTSTNTLSASAVVRAEVTGWSAMYNSQNYGLAADQFETVWEAHRNENIIEMGAFQKWTQAKAIHLQSTTGEPGAKSKALRLADEAIARGGRTSWFNRLRASLNRARNAKVGRTANDANDYGLALARAFDDFHEQVGVKERFEKSCQRISTSLSSDKHQEYCAGLEQLGKLLGYQAARPKGTAATDNRWRGTFGNFKEIFTFEAKIETTDGSTITPYHMGQAHIQLNRALAEFEQLGYSVRSVILTHLDSIDPSARSSAGMIRIVRKEAVFGLWKHVEALLRIYANGWSVDDVPARLAKAQTLIPLCPSAGWLTRVLDQDALFISEVELLRGWPQS